MKKTTVDSLEVAKFAQLSSQWWDTNGPLKTLHDINPTRLDFIQQFIALKDKTVLDVGCGGGILCEGMAERGAEVTGLDVEIDAITSARAHAKVSKLKIEYRCEPIEDYAPLKPFQIVTCMEMLEHVTAPELVLEHCVRVLEPGGYLFLSTINRTISAYGTVILAAEYLLNLLPRQTHDFDKFIKPSELASMVRAMGLEIVGLTGMAYNPLTRLASLKESVSANYLLACRKFIR